MSRIRGWTLVEVLVAVVVLSLAATALAAGLGYAYRVRKAALRVALATAVAESWIERWRAGPWTGARSGSRGLEVGGHPTTLEWVVIGLDPCLDEAIVTARVGEIDSERVTLSTRRFREQVVVC